MSVSHSGSSEPRARLLLAGQTKTERVHSEDALDHEATSDAAKIFRAFNLLAAVWWLMLLVSAIALVLFAFLTPDVAYFTSTITRDAEIHSINSVTDIGLLQRKAVLDVSEGYATGATATFLCHFALYTLSFMIVGSIVGLLLIRWMKRHLTPAEADTDTDTAPASSEQSRPFRL